MNRPLLEARSLSKTFGPTRALDRVSLEVSPGEVLAVVGENGAGKSTLMKLLAGIQQPDDGSIVIDDEMLEGYDVAEALKRGIVLIHQELNLASNLSVAENIFLGREPRRYGFVRGRKLINSTSRILERVGLEVSPKKRVGDLQLADQQQVEIARALSLHARVIIFDEPTSSLTLEESGKLFKLIRELTSQGMAVLYISHRLAEITEIADRALVLRDGKSVGILKRGEISHDSLINLMIGRSLSDFYVRHGRKVGKELLRVTDLKVSSSKEPVSLSVREGELVGLAGLVGSGRTELLRAIFGIDQALSGSVEINDKRIHLGGIKSAIAAGTAFIPESRKDFGLILDSSISENISLAEICKSKRKLLNRRIEEKSATSFSRELDIKSASIHQRAKALSGGNQQKVVLAKWLALKPSVLLLDEPMRGIDVGAKQELFKVFERLAGAGAAILMVSSDLEELIAFCDRMYVMHDGTISGELTQSEFSEESILRLATGTE